MECIRILPKRTIDGNGDTGASEAPAQRMKMDTEVAVAADEVSRGLQRDLDFVAAVMPPQPEPEVHNYSGNDSDFDGKPISPPSPDPFVWNRNPWLCSPSPWN